MRITLVTIGSRGDAEPYVALGSALARAGHAVRVATCEPFRDFVSARGLEFARLGGDIKAIAGDEGRAALLAAGAHPLHALRALRRYVGPLVREAQDGLDAALAGSDVVIGHLLVPAAIYYAERHGMLYIEASYDPTLPTRAFAHPGAPVSTPRGLASLASHVIAEQLVWQAFRADVDAFRGRVLGLGRSPLLGPHTLRLSRRAPSIMGFSPEVVAPPRDWPEHAFVTGYWFLDTPSDYSPPPRLAEFLAAGEPPVYVGFGSMTVERPEELTAAVIEGVRRAGRRAVLSVGWGGLAELPDTRDVMFTGDVPHGWLFPRVAAVVHHGGPGTAAAAFRAGAPQMAIPFLADQPFWGDRIARLGAGPEPVPISRLTPDRLHQGLAFMDAPAVRRAAESLGSRIRAERGAENAVAVIERLAVAGRAAKR
jgi:sterol 3beta-glucosyltransferase